MPLPFDLTIVHPDSRACETFRSEFRSLPRVEILRSRHEDLPSHDCFVAAGNSFGIMKAGIDAAVAARLGDSVIESVQREILDRHLGEQLVGTAFLVETKDPERPYLCHAPTMRLPALDRRDSQCQLSGVGVLHRDLSRGADRRFAGWASRLVASGYQDRGLPRYGMRLRPRKILGVGATDGCGLRPLSRTAAPPRPGSCRADRARCDLSRRQDRRLLRLHDEGA